MIDIKRIEETRDYRSAIDLLLLVNTSKSVNCKDRARALYLLAEGIELYEIRPDSEVLTIEVMTMAYQQDRVACIDDPWWCVIVAKLIHISPWNFGISERMGQPFIAEAEELERIACVLDPERMLFRWALAMTHDQANTDVLAKQIIEGEPDSLEQLANLGLPGQEMLDVLHHRSTP